MLVCHTIETIVACGWSPWGGGDAAYGGGADQDSPRGTGGGADKGKET
jgi:hypothetical protein